MNEPAPITPTPPRPYRSNATEEPWLPPEPGARARPVADLNGLAGELSARLNPPDLAPPTVRAEPRVAAARAERAGRRSPQNDHNLAEMAQQLEAALRRTPVAETRPPVTDPLAAAAKSPESPRGLLREPRMRHEVKPEVKTEAKLEPKLEPAATPGKNLYDNLEQEMASLLGRPPGKT